MIHDDDLEKKELFNAIFSLGFNFFAQGKYANAKIIFDGLMVLIPNDPAPFLAYGEALLFEEKTELALLHFLRTKEKFASDSRVLIGASKAYILLGKYDDARELLTTILASDIKRSSGDIFTAQSMLIALRECEPVNGN